MALAFTAQSQVNTTTNATSYATTASFTPSANSLLICIVCASSTDTTQTDPTSVSGNGVTYSELDSVFQSGVDTVGLWVGTTASPSAGVVTASGWGTSRTGCNMTVIEVTGADMSSGTTSAIVAGSVQKHNGTGTATTASLTMNAAADSNDRAFGFFVHTANETVAADANNTLGSTGSYATPNRGAGFVWNTSAFNNPGVSWTTSAAWRAIGAEVAVAVAATVTPNRNWHGPAVHRQRPAHPGPRIGWR
jgi:hypothetical protein